MAYNFEEFANDEAEALEREVADDVQAINDAMAGEPADDFSEEERRLEQAHYYRLLLNGQLFSTADATAKLVEQEVRSFIKGRLRVLLGMEVEKVQQEARERFSEEEVQALRAVAARIMGKPGIVAAPMAKKKLPESLNPVAVPAPARATSPTPDFARAVKKQKAKQEDIENLPEGAMVKRGGKSFRVRKATMPDGSTKAVLQDVTKIPANPNRIPMPSTPQAMAAATAHAAAQATPASGLIAGNLGPWIADPVEK